MASTNGIIGGITGKLGNAVFYYRNGKYVAREYISNPVNPKSSGQTAARLKMALAGQFSKIVPVEAIEGFDGNRTTRRSKFLSGILRAATVSGNRASVAFGDVMFSEGNLAVVSGHAVIVGTPTDLTRSLSIRTGRASADGPVPDGYGERYVVVLLNNETSQFDYVVSGLVVLPETSGVTVDTEVTVRVGDKSSSYTALVYVYPFVSVMDSEGRGVAGYSYLGAEDGTVVVDLKTGETLGRPAAFGASLFVSSKTLVPPSQSKPGKESKDGK